MADGILVKIGLNSSAYKRGLHQVEQQAQQTGKAMQAALSQFGSVGGLVGAGGMAGVVGLLGSVAKKGDEIADGAKRMGVSASEYQKFAFAADQAGSSIEDVSAAVKKMKVNISEAADGSKTASDTLDKLGLSATELRNMSPDEQFKKIAQALMLVSNETDRAAMAQEVFGKAGQNLLPLIDSFQELAAEAENAGLMSDSAVDAADRLSDSMKSLNASLTALVSNTGIIDFFASLAEELQTNATLAEKAAKSGVTGKGARGGIMGAIEDYARYMDDNFGKAAPLAGLTLAAMGVTHGEQLTTKAATQEEVAAHRKKELEKASITKKSAETKAQIAQNIANKQREEEGREFFKYVEERKKTWREVDKAIADADKVLKESQGTAKEMTIEGDLKMAEQQVADNEKLMEDRKSAAEDASKLFTSGRDMPTLRAIGANLPGNINPSDSVNLDRQRNDMITKILATITSPDFAKSNMKVEE